MIVGVPKESYPGERRVGLVPMVLPSLLKAGFEVVVEAGAGVEAGYPDQHYIEKGAKILQRPGCRVQRGRYYGPGPVLWLE